MIWYTGGPGTAWPEGFLGWKEETAETAAEVMVTGAPTGRTHSPGYARQGDHDEPGRAPARWRGRLDAHGLQDDR